MEFLFKEKLLKILDGFISTCLICLIALLPISNAAIEICAVLAILAFIIKKYIFFDFGYLKNYIYFFLFMYIIALGLSLINSGVYLHTSLKTLFLKWLEYITLFLIVGETIDSAPKILKKFLIVSAFVSGLLGIDGLYQKIIGFDFLRNYPLLTDISAITGPFYYHNDFATYLSFSFFLIFGFFLQNKDKHFLLLLLILLSINLLFTYSRGGWVGFTVGFLFCLLVMKKKKWIVIFLGVFVLILFLFPSFRQRAFFSFFNEGYTIRLSIWENSLLMVKKNFFIGRGVGSFMNELNTYKSNLGWQYAHNCYLQMLVETGVIGLLSFLIFVFSIFLKAVKKFKISKNFVLLGITGGLFSFLVHSFFDTQFYSLKLSVLFWLWLGVVTRLSVDIAQKGEVKR